ncbi:hypothetical protein CRG98_019434 [Punica granatum]|uniref:Uncharacterized protein n=1 Tax=Punica granatum TaxID=22663 RepID=A0A2I0JV26_PUNGR|nr:hypothetical protein CRG98_019434 [Punica granatum]
MRGIDDTVDHFSTVVTGIGPPISLFHALSKMKIESGDIERTSITVPQMSLIEGKEGLRLPIDDLDLTLVVISDLCGCPQNGWDLNSRS